MENWNPQPVDSLSLRIQIEEQIRNAILSGTFMPGERLVESAIARQLKVSRAPIREALSALEKEGIAKSVRRKGYFVISFGPHDIREMYSLRFALERLAIELPIKKYDEQKLGELQSLVTELGKAIHRGIGRDAIARLDLEVHERIVQLPRHERLHAAWSNLRSQTLMLIGLTSGTQYEYAQQPRDFHQSLINAVMERDVAKAVTELKTHIAEGEHRARVALQNLTDIEFDNLTT